MHPRMQVGQRERESVDLDHTQGFLHKLAFTEYTERNSYLGSPPPFDLTMRAIPQ